MDTNPSKEELIESLQSFAADLDSVPTIRKMKTEGPYSPYQYKKEFGSWHEALRAADIQPTHGVDLDIPAEEILADLRRIDKLTDGAPRREDVEEHGEYPYDVYQDEFDSFVRALEEAGIEPDEKQYRFSSVETPEEKKGSANIETLRNEGPVPGSALPNDRSMKDREYGMWKFDITSGAIKPADPIYYLNGEHSPELVIRQFFEENPHVLEYRDPHGLKIAIKDHKPSWQETGIEIVDELIAGREETTAFENLVIVRVHTDDTLRYCFSESITTPRDAADLPLPAESWTDRRPLWGLPPAAEEFWTGLSNHDGILFSTTPGVFTHYVPIIETIENSDVMTELWVEYEDGIRTKGISEPWPYLLIGEDVEEIDISADEFETEIAGDLSGESVEFLDQETLEPLITEYTEFETFLRAGDYRTASDELTDGPGPDASEKEIVAFLEDVSPTQLPIFASDSPLADIPSAKCQSAFETAITNTYAACAVCGRATEAPDGSRDLSAVRLLPETDDGPALIQNGLGLCSKHRWAVEHGWFKITEEYEITVQHRPELAGYNELNQFDGQYLQVPKNEARQPHPEYIRKRNDLTDK